MNKEYLVYLSQETIYKFKTGQIDQTLFDKTFFFICESFLGHLEYLSSEDVQSMIVICHNLKTIDASDIIAKYQNVFDEKKKKEEEWNSRPAHEKMFTGTNNIVIGYSS
jgi:hypothetical protein